MKKNEEEWINGSSGYMKEMGQRVILLEDVGEFKKGHQFTVVGSSGMRGLNLEDDDGNRIDETAFIRNKYEFIHKLREDKLKELLDE